MGVRPDEDVVAELGGVAVASAQERVLHHDTSLSDSYVTVLGSDDRAEEDSSVGSDVDVSAQDGGRCDVGGGIDDWLVAAVFVEGHGSSWRSVSWSHRSRCRGRRQPL